MPRKSDKLLSVPVLQAGVQSWPLLYLLGSRRPEAASELARRAATEAERTAQTLVASHQAAWALPLLAQAGLTAGRCIDVLNQARVVEIGSVAMRRLALAELNRLAGEHGTHMLLIKGAATSQCVYPNETARYSSDIDVVLPEHDLRQLFPEDMSRVDERLTDTPFPDHHIERKVMHQTPVEFHYRLEFRPLWGSAEHLLVGAQPCPDYENLRVPTPEVMLTIALLHMLKHRGQMPHDLADILALDRWSELDWASAEGLWEKAGLRPYIAAPLALASQVIPVGEDAARRVWQAMTAADVRQARTFWRGLTTIELPRMQAVAYECDLMGIPFLRHCLQQFFGSRPATARLTGLSPRDPRFWLWHVLVLPVRRVFRLATHRMASGN